MSVKHHGNTREFSRVPIRLDVTVCAGATVIEPEHTTDLSMKSVFVIGEPSIPRGTDCRVILHLDGKDGTDKVEVWGRVARVTADGFAIEFTELDLDSYTHLRNLVRFNAEDVTKVERELNCHLGLKRAE